MILFRLISFCSRIFFAFFFVMILQIEWNKISLEERLVRFGKNFFITKFLNQEGSKNNQALSSFVHSIKTNKQNTKRGLANKSEVTNSILGYFSKKYPKKLSQLLNQFSFPNFSKEEALKLNKELQTPPPSLNLKLSSSVPVHENSPQNNHSTNQNSSKNSSREVSSKKINSLKNLKNNKLLPTKVKY